MPVYRTKTSPTPSDMGYRNVFVLQNECISRERLKQMFYSPKNDDIRQRFFEFFPEEQRSLLHRLYNTHLRSLQKEIDFFEFLETIGIFVPQKEEHKNLTVLDIRERICAKPKIKPPPKSEFLKELEKRKGKESANPKAQRSTDPKTQNSQTQDEKRKNSPKAQKGVTPEAQRS